MIDSQGKPVDQAMVMIRRSDAGSGFTNAWGARSDANGYWTWEDLRPGVYTVTASRKGYASSEVATVEVPEDGESPEVTSVLRELSESGTLVSVVYRFSDGAPLKEAWARLQAADGSYFESDAQRDAQGVLTIEGIPPGTYDVEISAWGYSVVNHPDTVIRLGETVHFEDVLYDCGAFEWSLKDMQGAPLKDVPVRLTPNDPASIETVREGTTNAQGVHTTRGLFPGKYTATATPPGRSPVSVQVTVTAHELTRQTTMVESFRPPPVVRAVPLK